MCNVVIKMNQYSKIVPSVHREDVAFVTMVTWWGKPWGDIADLNFKVGFFLKIIILESYNSDH